MEQTECSETSEFKLQTQVNNPEESIQRSKNGESMKSRISCLAFHNYASYKSQEEIRQIIVD
jgi:hypothetical protein